ncbi:MAG TPA: hypothetical protein VN428_06915 [Bryobacteraceae bacterium]|nr:hypothetical protein [Bryobacteraceae bacterium]
MRSLPAAILGVFLFIAAPLLADDPMTNLRVEVRTHSDKPVERASVIVRFVEGRSVTKLGKKVVKNWELRTNQEGVAKVPLAMPQGKIQIQVIAKNYQTFGQVYDVDEEEKTIVIKLNAPQPQHSEHQ